MLRWPSHLANAKRGYLSVPAVIDPTAPRQKRQKMWQAQSRPQPGPLSRRQNPSCDFEKFNGFVYTHSLLPDPWATPWVPTAALQTLHGRNRTVLDQISNKITKKSHFDDFMDYLVGVLAAFWDFYPSGKLSQPRYFGCIKIRNFWKGVYDPNLRNIQGTPSDRTSQHE